MNINTNKDEINKLHAVQMYWCEATCYEPIASTLTLKSNKKFLKFLHVVDNAEKDKPEYKKDKCFKVKPLADAVRAICQKVEQEVNNSIDE